MLNFRIEMILESPHFFLTNMFKRVNNTFFKNCDISTLVIQVKDVYLHPEMFTIENGLLTPTLKAKRAELKALFLPQIDQLYAKIQ